ncbi:MAG: phage holin [Bacteroidaceae bacterium]|nr:phage holin [Bacteroidaceae bacterium]
MSNKTYDILKFIAQIVLPALGALYFGLAKYWNLPYPEEIVGTITVLDTFLGTLLGISSANYYKEHDKIPANTNVETEYNEKH